MFKKRDIFQTDMLKAEFAHAKKLGKAINADELNAFDRASIDFVNDFKDTAEVEAFREQMKRICELAGINYALEKSLWWKKYNRLKKRD